jgi:hypothetical protein
MLVCVLAACVSQREGEGGLPQSDSEESFLVEGVEISALAAIGRSVETISGPLYEGDGCKDIRLAVLAPETQGDVPTYLPVYVQGLLNNNFRRYSGITLIDRQNLDKILAEQELTANARFSDKEFVSLGNLTNAHYLLIGTIQKLSGGQYSLQLSVTEAGSGERKFSFIGNGTLTQIEGSGTLINVASVDILTQMGVRLTEAGRRSLAAGNISVVRAETGLAKGITAQSAGAQVEALFNYSQAIAFDPSQLEALSRLNQLSTSISGGSIGERILNDIQARDRWIESMKETARFFKEHPPFEITFDPNLIQEGNTDYANRTADIAMRVALTPVEAGFTALDALLEGLEKTGRRAVWGFANWPLGDSTPKMPDIVIFGGKRSAGFTLGVTLLNDSGKPLGQGRVTLDSGDIRFAAGNKKVTPPSGTADLLRFTGVRADDLTPVLTLVVSEVNGIPSRTVNATGYMQIAPGDVAETAVRQAQEWRRRQEEVIR